MTWRLTPEQIAKRNVASAKRSKERIGKKLPPETRAKMSASAKARWDARQGESRKHSPEHAAKIAAALARRFASAAGDEIRAKLSAALKGRKHAPEHTEKIKSALRKAYADPELRERVRQAQKAGQR